ncbi:hypothetical protein F1734_17490 [Rhodococcus ruber]|uniref:hypothetical protein n=1 Tax=Rhodococcus ruber TaxID=1830 RepID=UPI001931780E|nr:hypothetical protein [Rhodococcus ruber]QRE81860.1 hypothetical protein F1734_17490 [Rhodococcus ruber]
MPDLAALIAKYRAAYSRYFNDAYDEDDAWEAARETIGIANELVDTLADADPSTVADGFGIKSLQVQDGAADLKFVANTEQAEHLMLAISDACGHMLDSNDATNYVEFQVSKRGRPTYVVHVRRYMRPTPHKLREQAEARAERAEAALERVRSLTARPDGSSRPDEFRILVSRIRAALDGDQ